MTNTLKLKSILVEKGYSMKMLAQALGISSTSLSYKVNNKREFTSSEIKNAQEFLEIDDSTRDQIFFYQL